MTAEEREVLDRRMKVEAWQAKKRAIEEAAASASKAKEEDSEVKGWTLEDDGSDLDDDPPQVHSRDFVFKIVSHVFRVL